MPKQRPTPEKLLQRATEEESHQSRGKLKIYLGAAPGVGKTYTMIEDALAKRAQGIDIIIGVVESHGRREIESLLGDLPVLPYQTIEYRDHQLKEFDLDAALKRNPTILLIDEMAHTNAPGLRHTKRWQDIKELLDRGITVYTTLNVQHIDSLNDAVSQILNTEIKEIVPDFMIDLADTIELIDIPPEDLLKRLEDGKIYVPQQALLATKHFFRKGNLSALRELALRVTAEAVETQVLLYRKNLGISHIWPTKEKLLVCVSATYQSTKLIRTTKRMASRLKVDWSAVYVDTPELQISEEKRNSAIQNLRLAERLGATTTILTGLDVADEIINFAHENNITRIVIGKNIHARWRNFFRGTLADKIIRQSGEVDVYLITDEFHEIKPVHSTQTKRPWRIYAISIAVLISITMINYFFQRYLQNGSSAILYLVGVTTVALFGELGPALLTSILSIILYDICFIPPFYCLANKGLIYHFNLALLFLMMLVISYLAIISRRQAKAVHLAERHTNALYTLTRQLATTRGVDNLLEIAAHYLADVFNSEITALLPENNQLVIQNKNCAPLDNKELSVAQWVYTMGQMAGLGTDTLPFSTAIYLPLLGLHSSGSQKSIGVLRVQPIQPQHLFTPEQTRLLESCVNLIALAIEVDRSNNN